MPTAVVVLFLFNKVSKLLRSFVFQFVCTDNFALKTCKKTQLFITKKIFLFFCDIFLIFRYYYTKGK